MARTKLSGSGTYGIREVVWSVRETPDPIPVPGDLILGPASLETYARHAIPQDGREYAIAIMLNTRARPCGHYIISIGMESTSLVRPVEAFGHLLRAGLSRVAFVHNHPSGDPEPSDSDRMLSARLGQAARLLAIDLVDFAIVGSGTGRFFSFKSRGMLV